MGRKRQAAEKDTGVPSTTGLAEAFVGWPRSNKDKYHLKFSWAKDEQLAAYHKFSAAYAAKKFLEVSIAQRTTEWDGDDLIIDDTLIVSGPVEPLRSIFDHKYTKKEEEWELPIPYSSYALQLSGKPHPLSDPNRIKEQAATIRREKREPKAERTPRPSKEGLITIQAIAAELKMEPRDARAILRKSNTPKPEAGWAWSKKEADDIKKLLVKGAKK